MTVLGPFPYFVFLTGAKAASSVRKEAFLGGEKLLGFKPTNLFLIEKDAYST